jgi:hypothetical protein
MVGYLWGKLDCKKPLPHRSSSNVIYSTLGRAKMSRENDKKFGMRGGKIALQKCIKRVK